MPQDIKEKPFNSWLERLMPLLLAALSLIGMIAVAWIQTSKASTADLNYIVKEINESVIPSIKTELEQHDTTLDELREKIAYLTGLLQRRGKADLPMAVPEVAPVEHIRRNVKINKLEQIGQ